jgi:hypothetical protein
MKSIGDKIVGKEKRLRTKTRATCILKLER